MIKNGRKMVTMRAALCLTLASATLALAPTRAVSQTSAKARMTAALHTTSARGPLRTVDRSPFKGPQSSEILAGPDAGGIESAFLIYTRLAAGAGPSGLYTLPADHTYLVLSGKMTVQLGTDTFVVEPESLVFVPAGVPHQIWNASGAPVAEFEVVTPAPSRDLVSLMTPVASRKIDNAAQYIHVPPKLGVLAGGQGHESLNERVLVSRANGSLNVLERLNDVLPNGGRTVTHMHPFDQAYFVRSGTMTVQYGMANYEAKANTLVVLPAGVAHNNLNTGTAPQSDITLLLPEPEKGNPLGANVTIEARAAGGQNGARRTATPNGNGQ
jgi:mannose-6-phosphate isomerase-like protein (cupin superfamily)